MVASEASPMHNSQRGRGISVAESYLEALSHLLFAEPQTLPQLLDHDEASQAAFIDKWLGIATAKCARNRALATVSQCLLVKSMRVCFRLMLAF